MGRNRNAIGRRPSIASSDYAGLSHGMLTDCVLAIDGWVCKTRKPNAEEVDAVLSYRNR